MAVKKWTVCLFASSYLLPIFSLAQSPADRCQALTAQMAAVDLSKPGVPKACSQLEQLRLACNYDGDNTGDTMVQAYKQLCEIKQQEVQDAADKEKREPSSASSAGKSQDNRPAEKQLLTAPLEASLHANRDRVLQAVPALLQQSLSRSKINQVDLALLIALGQKLGEAYFEKRDGSALAYTSKQDDAQADARGFRKRESANFVVFYRAGDMVRAQTTLTDAEASIAAITAVMHHFPSFQEHHGRKLPIYLTTSTSAYTSFSKCSANSIACVTHIFFEDGDIQTMYISPKSYEEGTRAAQRVAAYKRTVQHELTHYAQFDMITTKSIGMPRWFIEGLASYVAGEQERIAALQSDAKAGRSLLSFADLQRGEVDLYNSPNALLYYQEGYAIFDMLVSTRGIEKTTALILDVTQQEDIESALSTTLGLTTQAFDQEWRSFEASRYGIIIPASTDLRSTLVETAFGARSELQPPSGQGSMQGGAGTASLDDTITFMQSHTLVGAPLVARGVIKGKGKAARFERTWTWTDYKWDGCQLQKSHLDKRATYEPATNELIGTENYAGVVSEGKWEPLSKLSPDAVTVTQLGPDMEKESRDEGHPVSITLESSFYRVGVQTTEKEPGHCDVRNPDGHQVKFPPEEHPEDWDCKTVTITRMNVFYAGEDWGLAERFSKALSHAIRLCGGRPEAF